MTIDQVVLVGFDSDWDYFIRSKMKPFIGEEIQSLSSEEAIEYVHNGINKDLRRLYLVDFKCENNSRLNDLWEYLAEIKRCDGDADLAIFSSLGNGPHSLPEGIYYFRQEDPHASMVALRKKHFE